VGYHQAKKGILPKVLNDTSRVPEEVVAVLGRSYGVSPHHSGLGHNQPSPCGMTGDIAAARGAQNVGMMISPLSTDPMREMLSRKRERHQKKAKAKKRSADGMSDNQLGTDRPEPGS